MSSLTKNKWAERILRAIRHLRVSAFVHEGEQYAISDERQMGSTIVHALQEWEGVQLIGRAYALDRRTSSGRAIWQVLKKRRLGRPQFRAVYNIHPDRLDEISRWAHDNPPLVLRGGRLLLVDDGKEQSRLPDFRWDQYPGGVRVG